MKCKNIILTIVIALSISSLAKAALFRLPDIGDDIVGHNFIAQVQRGDNAASIRARYEVSYNELAAANPGVNFNHLRVGQPLLIPNEFILPKYRQGIVINTPELRLYYFTPDGKYVRTFPVGLGKENWRTPLTFAKVVKKETDPTWHIPKSIHEYVYRTQGKVLPEYILPGPENPLGKYALYLSESGYMIHGTNQPESVGTFFSSGCMRLLAEPIRTLYQEVDIGTPVYIIHHPFKAGWMGEVLYFEAHSPVSGYGGVNSEELNNKNAEDAILKAIQLRPARISWALVKQIMREHGGTPEPIGKRFEIN